MGIIDQALVPSRLTAAETQAIEMVLDGLPSERSRRAYGRALLDFFRWHAQAGRPQLNKALVQRYAAELRNDGLSSSSINQRLSAIRKLALEAADNGALAVLIGCGLRRPEAANLSFDHVQQRDGRWVLVDFIGKRDKVRSVPMPAWTKAALDAWSSRAGVADGRVFRAVKKGDNVVGEGVTPQAIRNIVADDAEKLKHKGVAPHDLRRTFAKLAYKGGAALDQIQLSLGHESIQTTENYLGVEQDLTDAPCDHLGLRLQS